VRIGKGRFRIPDEELSRILHLSKKPVLVPDATSIVQSEAQIVPSADRSFNKVFQTGDAIFMESNANRSGISNGTLLAPNIFDWFIGLSAIVSGVALFLFNSTYTTQEFPKMMLIYPVIRTVLIAGGLGVLISGLFSQARGWRRVFYILLSAMGFLNAFGLIRSGDVDGGALYGALAFIVALTSFVPFGGVVSAGLYVSIIALLVPFVMLFFPLDSHMQSLSAFLAMPTLYMGIISLFVSLVLIITFWVGYAGNRRLFLVAVWLLTLGDVTVAMWYASSQYWSRSFFVMVFGAFTALLPYWWPLQQGFSSI
jgi:hypothetical protein